MDQAVEDVAHEPQVGFHADRDRTRELPEVGSDAVRHDGEDGDPQWLGGIGGDPLGQDAVDGQAQVAVLLGAAERQHGTIVAAQVLFDL